MAEAEVVTRLVEGMTRQLRRGFRPAALMAASDLRDLTPELGLSDGSTSERANELAGAIVRAIGAMPHGARDAASILMGIGDEAELTLTERRRLAAESLQLQPETFRRHRQRELLTEVARNVVLASHDSSGSNRTSVGPGRVELLPPQRDPRTVLVVSGREGVLRNEIESYLAMLGLRTMAWDQTAHRGADTTNLLEVLRSSIDIAQAVVIVLEGDSRGTPSPNLVLEAGFAIGLAPERTVIVTAGQLHVPSDLQGLPLLWNSQAPLLRGAVTRRLMSFGCQVAPTGRSIDTADPEPALDGDHERSARDAMDSAAAWGLATRIRDELPEIAQLNAIQKASSLGRLLILARPVVDLRSSDIVARELSVTLPDADAQDLTETQIRTLAERWGIIGEIDIQLGRKAIQLATDGHSVWTKMSAATLVDNLTLSVLRDEIERSGIDPALLTFEVSEGAVLGRTDTWKAVQALLALGCKVAVDEFGTGYSTLTNLRKLNASLIVLDHSFVERAATHESDRMIVLSTADLARALNMRSVAVGVADEQTLEAVRALGVELAMGEWIGPGEPADSTTWIRTANRGAA